MGLKGSPEVSEVLFHGDVVNPGLELRIEKLQPLLSDMEDQRAAKKQVLEAEAGGYASEIKKVPIQYIYIEREGERSVDKGTRVF